MKTNFEGVFIAPTATVIGNVQIAPGSSVWFGAVLRSDMALIQIGRNTSVQDNAIIHVSEGVETIIGDQVTIGHGAVSYTHLRAHETRHDLVCRLLLEKKKNEK